jgi:glucose-1-phosphate thymidylyltransferase
MKAIILAGGFAKRLWPLTKNKPKPLLEVGSKPIIQHVLDKLKDTDVNEIFISTNSKFEEQFKNFINNYKTDKTIKLIIEPTSSEGEKLGSIGGLNYLINKEAIDEDVLIIGGDNIFEFEINDLLNSYKERETSVIAVHDINDKELAKDYGIVDIDDNQKIIDFEEKPENPKTTLASTAIYIYPARVIKQVKDYLNEGNCPDKAGNFIKWLYEKEEVFAFVFKEKWFDIGCFKGLDEAKEYYKK